MVPINGRMGGYAWDGLEYATPYFPNCGADMRVKNDFNKNIEELKRVNNELKSEIEKSKSEIVPDYRDG